MKDHKAESIVYAILSGLLAVVSIPVAVYVLSFAWIGYGLLGVIPAGVGVAVCTMPIWCGYAARERWHGREVAG